MTLSGANLAQREAISARRPVYCDHAHQAGWLVLNQEPTGFHVAAEDPAPEQRADRGPAQDAVHDDGARVIKPDDGVGPGPQQVPDFGVAEGIEDPARPGNDPRHVLR